MPSISISILVNKSKIQSLTAQFLSIYSLLIVPLVSHQFHWSCWRPLGLCDFDLLPVSGRFSGLQICC